MLVFCILYNNKIVTRKTHFRVYFIHTLQLVAPARVKTLEGVDFESDAMDTNPNTL